MKTADDWFNEYAEQDSNINADRSKLMAIEEFRQAFGWYNKEIIKLINDEIKLWQNNPVVKTALMELKNKLEAK